MIVWVSRYFLYLGYNGKEYCGWQIQPNGMTVQQRIEEALSTILRKKISIVGAGRTDAGVHARLMVAHFDMEQPLTDASSFVDKLNRILPQDIAVYKIVPVISEAHARFDALSRTYRYYLTLCKNPFDFDQVCRYYGMLDFQLMNEACQALFEYSDFTSFSKLHTDVKTNNCKIMYARWHQEGSTWVFTIQADRFLRNMVRAIVGTLVDVGRGKLSVDGMRKVIELKDRCSAGMSMPGHALFLEDISYPEKLFLVEK